MDQVWIQAGLKGTSLLYSAKSETYQSNGCCHSHRRSLLILVEDMNDNAPVFGPHHPSVTLGENSRVGDYVATLAATDKDSGVFGQVGITFSNVICIILAHSFPKWYLSHEVPSPATSDRRSRVA